MKRQNTKDYWSVNPKEQILRKTKSLPNTAFHLPLLTTKQEYGSSDEEEGKVKKKKKAHKKKKKSKLSKNTNKQ